MRAVGTRQTERSVSTAVRAFPMALAARHVAGNRQHGVATAVSTLCSLIVWIMLCVVLLAKIISAQPSLSAADAQAAAALSLANLVQQHCAECHDADEPEAGLDLLAAFATKPAAERGSERAALHGRIWRVLHEGTMPPKTAGPFAATERAAMQRALETLLHNAELRQPSPPRRLSREEVRRSVRALLGVDVAAENLPEDELAFGFDNVANMRAVGGAVAEQLLRAAEHIAAQVLPEGMGRPPAERRMEAEEFRCNTECGALGSFVSLYMNSTLSARWNVKHAGVFELVVRAAGQQAGDESARMSVRIDGMQRGVHSVAATVNAPADYSCTFELSEGDHEISIAFVNDYYKAAAIGRPAADRNLLVDAALLRGPMRNGPHAPAQALLAPDVGPTQAGGLRARSVLQPLLRRLWRGAVDAKALSGLEQLVDARMRAGDVFEEALRTALAAALASPRFWLRSEVGSAAGQLSGATLASRLALLLWSSAPDAALLDAATRGALNTPQGLQSEAARMLRDPQASALAERFAPQWLELRNLVASAPDPQRFPTFTPALRSSMADEVVRFFEQVRIQELPARELLRASWSCVDAPLAALYGVPVPATPFARTELPGRGGLLGMAAMLTVTSNPGRTSPVKRGRWVLDHLLDAPPPPPPPNAGSLDERPEIADSLPLRERLALHRRDPSCASCHTRMDVLGFALEHFDGIGAWREKDGPHAIDSSGVLPDGRRVDGLAALKSVVAEDRAFLRGMLRALFTTAVGRQFGPADEVFLQRTLEALPADPSIHQIVLAVVGSSVFCSTARN